MSNPIKKYIADLFVTSGGTASQYVKGDGTLGAISGLTGSSSGIDIRVTGGTYSNGTASFKNNTGGTFTVIGFTNPLKYYAEPAAVPTSPIATGVNSIAIGNNAQANSQDMFVAGSNAGNLTTTAQTSVFIGFNSGKDANGSYSSNFIGAYAGNGTTNSLNSNFIGTSAGVSAGSTSSSNFIGFQAGYNATSSLEANFIGNNAGFLANSAGRSNFIGNNAGYNASGSKYSNFIGTSAGYSLNISSYSNLIGYRAGYNDGTNKIGDNNIVIGTNISLANLATNSINIGGVLFGFNTYATITGNPRIIETGNGRIGINKATDDSSNTLQVGGTAISTSWKTSGGTSSQFVKGDGTLDSKIYLTGTGTTNFIPKWNSTTGLRNSLLFDDGTNVGIGTNNPGSELEVNGFIRTNTGAAGEVIFGASGGVFITGDDTNTLTFNTSGIERVRISPSGVVGIGVIPKITWASSIRALQMGAFGTALSSFEGGGGITRLSHNAVFTGSSTAAYIINTSATYQYMDGDTISWYNAPVGTAGNPITFTERMRIANNGNVGIGISVPLAKLDVVGGGKFTTTNQRPLILQATTVGENYSVLKSISGTDLAYIGDTTSTIGGGGTSNSDLGIRVPNGHLILNPNGNVGIGTTSPTDKLTINTTVANDGIAFHYSNVIGYSKIGVQFDSGNDIGNYMTFNISNSASSPVVRMLIRGDGFVGIGPSTPDSKLHIHTTTNEQLLRLSTAYDTGQALIIQPVQTSVANGYFQVNLPNSVGWQKLAFVNCNVGIGLIDPQATLATKGTFRIAGQSGGYTTGDNPMFSFGAAPQSNVFGTIEMPFGDRLSLNSYHGYNFNVSKSTGTPVLGVGIDINGNISATGSITLSGGGLLTPPAVLAYGFFPQSGEGLGIVSVAAGISFWVGGTPAVRARVHAGGFDVNGNITATGTITPGSDVRLKTNIKPLENSLEKVLKVQGVSYDRVDNEDKNQIGFIAQELEKVFPELVKTDTSEEKMKSVNYMAMVAVLVDAMQEQQKQIEELKIRILTLEK